MDNLTPEQRKKNMQRIRSTGTYPERIISKNLKKLKVYFTEQPKEIFGKPDIAFKRKKIAVFIDSDFWHGHPKRCIMPSTNVDYWEQKIKRNKQRDKEVNKTLKQQGWTVVRMWEYDIKHNLNKCMTKILKALTTSLNS